MRLNFSDLSGAARAVADGLCAWIAAARSRLQAPSLNAPVPGFASTASTAALILSSVMTSLPSGY